MKKTNNDNIGDKNSPRINTPVFGGGNGSSNSNVDTVFQTRSRVNSELSSFKTALYIIVFMQIAVLITLYIMMITPLKVTCPPCINYSTENITIPIFHYNPQTGGLIG
jgi:type IV secretory pathway component VirB8